MQAQQETMSLSDLLFEYSGTGYMLSRADSGVIVRVNQVFANMLGMRPDEIVGKTWQALTPKDVLQQELAMIDKLRAAELARYEKAFLRKDGSQVPVIISYKSQPSLYEGLPVLAASVLDISEIKAREKELAEEQHFWQFIFERTPVGMALFDAKGRYYMVNEAYAEMLEYDKQTLVDPNFDWKIPWRECLQETMEQVEQCQRTGQPVSYQSVIIAKNGKKVHCITRFFKIPPKGDLQGKEDLFIAFHTDISDLKARENEMQETITYTEMLLDQLAGGHFVLDHAKSGIDAIARIQKRFNSTVSALADLIAQIMQAGEKIEDVASTLADNQKEVAKRIEDESASLEQISASLEEMRATTQNVARKSDETLKVAIETDESSELAATKMMELKQLIDDLGETAKTTTTILRSIADIAFTTNLLSLNASVEAARAGEHGRGFAVIATEIRRLANKSSEDVKSIESWFETLKQRISNGQRAMAESLAQLQGIDSKAAMSKQMMQEVARATQETESGIAQIQEALLHLEEGMQYITQESEQISVIADELLEEAHNLAAEAVEFTIEEEKTPDLLPPPDGTQANIKRLPTRL